MFGFPGRSSRLSVVARVASAVFALAAAQGAVAQQPKLVDDPALKQQHDMLFAQVLKDPANVDTSFRYSEVATKLGDYEAAIGALERIIFYNPNLPRVRLELGLLYFRLGSYEMARSYFESAISAADTPVEVRNRVAGFLTEIERRVQTTQLSFFGQTGLRYQTNANAGPNTLNVRALGFDAVLSRQYAKRPDWNAFALGSMRYVYDFENQRGDVLEAQVTGYYSRQFKVMRLNTGLLEGNFGPRLALHPDALPGWSIKPYVIASGVTLGDKPYMFNAGLGVTMAIPMIVALLEPGYEIRKRNFRNSTDVPNATEQQGRLHTGFLNASGTFLPELRWNSRIAFNRGDTQRDYNAYRSIALDVGLAYEFVPPMLESARKWTLAPFVGFSRTSYDEANWVVDPNTRRKDREWRVGAGLDMAIWSNVGVGVLIQYTNVRSNIPNYSTRNFSATFGPTVRF